MSNLGISKRRKGQFTNLQGNHMFLDIQEEEILMVFTIKEAIHFPIRTDFSSVKHKKGSSVQKDA